MLVLCQDSIWQKVSFSVTSPQSISCFLCHVEVFGRWSHSLNLHVIYCAVVFWLRKFLYGPVKSLPALPSSRLTVSLLTGRIVKSILHILVMMVDTSADSFFCQFVSGFMSPVCQGSLWSGQVASFPLLHGGRWVQHRAHRFSHFSLLSGRTVGGHLLWDGSVVPHCFLILPCCSPQLSVRILYYLKPVVSSCSWLSTGPALINASLQVASRMLQEAELWDIWEDRRGSNTCFSAADLSFLPTDFSR